MISADSFLSFSASSATDKLPEILILSGVLAFLSDDSSCSFHVYLVHGYLLNVVDVGFVVVIAYDFS